MIEFARYASMNRVLLRINNFDNQINIIIFFAWRNKKVTARTSLFDSIHNLIRDLQSFLCFMIIGSGNEVKNILMYVYENRRGDGLNDSYLLRHTRKKEKKKYYVRGALHKQTGKLHDLRKELV